MWRRREQILSIGRKGGGNREQKTTPRQGNSMPTVQQTVRARDDLWRCFQCADWGIVQVLRMVEFIEGERVMIYEFNEHVRGFAQSELSKRDLIANFAMGLSGEAGEVTDLLKKHLYHGDDLDRQKLIKEAGDVIWYWFALLQQFDISPEEVMQVNIEKLRARHGGTSFNREAQRISKQNFEES